MGADRPFTQVKLLGDRLIREPLSHQDEHIRLPLSKHLGAGGGWGLGKAPQRQTDDLRMQRDVPCRDIANPLDQFI